MFLYIYPYLSHPTGGGIPVINNNFFLHVKNAKQKTIDCELQLPCSCHSPWRAEHCRSSCSHIATEEQRSSEQFCPRASSRGDKTKILCPRSRLLTNWTTSRQTRLSNQVLQVDVYLQIFEPHAILIFCSRSSCPVRPHTQTKY